MAVKKTKKKTTKKTLRKTTARKKAVKKTAPLNDDLAGEIDCIYHKIDALTDGHSIVSVLAALELVKHRINVQTAVDVASAQLT